MITRCGARAGSTLVLTALTVCAVATFRTGGLAAQNRMPAIPEAQWTQAQREAAAEFMQARGNLSGPWHAILRSPGMLNPARMLSDYLRSGTRGVDQLREARTGRRAGPCRRNSARPGAEA